MAARGCAREARLRGRVRDAHLALSDLRLRAQGRAIAAFGASQAGQEHHAALEHDPGGMGPSLAVEGATTARVFETYVEKLLAPSLEEGQIVIMDNLGAHRPKRIGELIEEKGCELLLSAVLLSGLQPDRRGVCQDQASAAQGLGQDERGSGRRDRSSALCDQCPRRAGLLRTCRISLPGSPAVKRAVRTP